MNRWLTIAFSLTLAACAVDSTPSRFELASRPEGVWTKASTTREHGGTSFSGELLAVRDDGLLLLVPGQDQGTITPDQVVELPFEVLHKVRFEYVGDADIISRRKEADREAVKRIRLISRFPQGLSDEVLGRLLAEIGQQDVIVVGGTGPSP